MGPPDRSEILQYACRSTLQDARSQYISDVQSTLFKDRGFPQCYLDLVPIMIVEKLFYDVIHCKSNSRDCAYWC